MGADFGFRIGRSADLRFAKPDLSVAEVTR